MKFIVRTNDEYYITILEVPTDETESEAVEVPDEVLQSGCMNCYKYENGEFTLDEDKKKKQLASVEIEQFKRELATYDYIGTKIAMGVATKEDYATEIAYTETLREKIRELEK